MVLLGPELHPRVMSVPVVLLQPWSVLMPVPPVTIEGQKDMIVQSWVCPSLATATGRSGPTPHQLQHWRVQGSPSPHLSSMKELTLLVGMGAGCP